jgi:CheY-like chemotaxis protein
MSLGSLLVAEADPMQRQLIDLLFSVDGSDVTTVESGAEALAHLREHTPSAVILATDLPDVPGTTICQKLKSVSRLAQVPVVLVAPEPKAGAGVADTLRRDARLVGADLLVHRPLGDKNLRERLQRLINSPRSDPGLGPIPVNTTSVLELDAALRRTPTPAPVPGGAASELGALRAEVAKLRDENDQLKARIAKYKHRLKDLKDEVEELRKKPRGLFGRRA